MEALPEEPQTINAQLRELPAYRTLLAPTPEPVPVPTIASRVVATLMQLKDTAAILLLLSDGSLLFGIICGFGVPGLVLYGLRWRQVRGRAGRGAIVAQAMLSLLHECFWAYSFYGERTATEPAKYHEILTVLYGLGALLGVVQLLVMLLGTPDEDASYASLTDEQSGE